MHRELSYPDSFSRFHKLTVSDKINQTVCILRYGTSTVHANTHKCK